MCRMNSATRYILSLYLIPKCSWVLFQIEIDIYVDLSARQRKLYKALLANVSVADLLEKAANMSDADSARSLMNLVMQFRKVRSTRFAIYGYLTDALTRSAIILSFSSGQMLSHHSHSRCLASLDRSIVRAISYSYHTLLEIRSSMRYRSCSTMMAVFLMYLKRTHCRSLIGVQWLLC